jgi:hypothetical protein
MARILNDFQIYKGLTLETVEPFGEPVMSCHEAQLLIRDDQKHSTPAAYFIHRRSENRILRTFLAPEMDYLDLAA